MRIFISFSGETRTDYALKFMDFFNANGIKCWYDHHELFLGDNLRETITHKGIQQSQYCILIINKNFLNRNWPCEEAKLFYERYINGEDVTLFPVLLDISKDDLKESKLSFLLSIKYQFLKSGEKVDRIGYQILNRIFNDIKCQNSMFSFEDIKLKFRRLTLNESINIFNVLDTIDRLSPTDYRDRAILLICLIMLFDNSPYIKTVQKISYMIYENYPINFDIYKIIENIFVLSSIIFLEA